MALNKQVVIGRSITEGEEELLSNFLKCYPLTDYKVNISNCLLYTSDAADE